jgi:hypothetical protein
LAAIGLVISTLAACAGPNKTERYLWACRARGHSPDACIRAHELDERDVRVERERKKGLAPGPGEAFEGTTEPKPEPTTDANAPVIDDKRRLVYAGKLHATGVGLTAPGAVATGVGAIMSFVGLAMLSGPGGYTDDGPNCTVGKPCGDTCIEMSDTCHIPPSGSTTTAPSSGPSAGFWIGTAVTLGVGVAALITGIALLKRAKGYGYGSNVQIGAVGLRVSF